MIQYDFQNESVALSFISHNFKKQTIAVIEFRPIDIVLDGLLYLCGLKVVILQKADDFLILTAYPGYIEIAYSRILNVLVSPYYSR